MSSYKNNTELTNTQKIILSLGSDIIIINKVSIY